MHGQLHDAENSVNARSGALAVRPWRMLSALLLLAATAWTQQPTPDGAPRDLPTGARINSISVYAESYSLQYQGIADNLNMAALWLAVGGSAADVSWRLPSRRMDASVNYQIAYNHNQRFSSLNGFDHVVALTLGRDVTRKFNINLEANVDSRIMSGALFEPTRILTSAQDASSPDQLARGLLDSGAATASVLPLDLVLFGTRRTAGLVRTAFTYSQSRRLVWSGELRATRILRASSEDAALASQYPSVTLAGANVGLTYSISPRTRIGGSAEYSRVYSQSSRYQSESTTIRLMREVGRRSFAHLATGYERVSGLGMGTYGRYSYTVDGGLGTMAGNHTLMGSFRHGITNLYGLPADNSNSVMTAWSWARPTFAWTFGTSFSYERLEGSALGLLEAFVYQANITRQLTSRSRIEITGVVLRGVYAGTSRGDFTTNAFRISWIWAPHELARRL